MNQYYDIGLNLFSRQFSNPEKILSDAKNAGVACILTGSSMQDSEKVQNFILTHSAWGTAGIHPHNADSATETDFCRLEQIITENPRIVAVGECGLDFDRMFSTKENQLNCLKQHIAIAKRTGKPMFLHEREASDAFIQVFQEYPEICRKSVVHCFTGDKNTLENYLQMGFHIGITGWICDDRRADALREAVSILPLDRVMLETDAPYLTPRNIKGLGRINVPQNIQYVARTLAGYLHTTEQELIAHAKENTERFFGICAE